LDLSQNQTRERNFRHFGNFGSFPDFAYFTDLTSTPDQTPTPFDTELGGTLDKTKEPEGEEEMVYLLMSEDRVCERCGCEVWKVQRRDYGKRGWGRCAKCGHVSFLGNLSKGQVLSKADVEYFFMLM
jgi:hypothetical protein